MCERPIEQEKIKLWTAHNDLQETHPLILVDMDDDEFDELDVDSIIEDPYVKVDEKTSAATLALAREVFDGILTVEFRTWWFWSSHMVLAYSHLRGIDGMMIDFYDHPEKVQEIFQRLTSGYIKKLHQIEQDVFLYNNVGNTFVGSGGLDWINELHPDPKHMKLQDMWGLCEAQEAVGMSPAMFHEFIFPYHKFGLTCYACCEPADPFWDDIKQLHNLRRVSVSQWANAEKMSEFLNQNYVYSYKACSSDVAVPCMDEDHIRKTLAHTLSHTRNNNVSLCRVYRLTIHALSMDARASGSCGWPFHMQSLRCC